MGFIVMVSAAIIGILLLVAGIKNIKKNWLWLLAIIVGVSFIGFAIFLSLPH